MHLGPLGELRPITPLKNVDTSPQRFGGVHTALTGSRTVDYLGARRTYEMSWKALPPASELAWLEALYYRQVPGPVRLLLDEMGRNRLSRSAASAGYGGRSMSAIQHSGGNLRRGAWPEAEVGLPGRGLQWSGWQTGSHTRLDWRHPAPVLAGETVTASWWVRASHGDEVSLLLDQHGLGGHLGADETTTSLTGGTWTRLVATLTPSQQVWGLSLALAPQTRTAEDSTLTLGPAQLEAGSQVTGWSQGGAAPVVSVGQLATSSPYAPYTRPTLSLLEL